MPAAPEPSGVGIQRPAALTRSEPACQRDSGRVMTPFPGLPVTVRSSHIDMFGHVNHTCYLEYMEWARFAWAEHGGAPIPKVIAEERVGPAILKADVRYRRECRLGDALLVTVNPLSARRQIGRLHQQVIRVEDGEVACEAELTFVMMNLDTRSAAPLPQLFLDLLPRG
jgi:YbgC/YbaW family acyl-CoA thioester hydrolase